MNNNNMVKGHSIRNHYFDGCLLKTGKVFPGYLIKQHIDHTTKLEGAVGSPVKNDRNAEMKGRGISGH